MRRNASRRGIGLILEARNSIWLLPTSKRGTVRYNFADLERNLPFDVLWTYISSNHDWSFRRWITQISFFLRAIVRLHLSRLRFFRDRLPKMERSLVYHENRAFSPNVLKIRKGRNTIYGQYAFLVPVDLHFSRLHVLPGRARGEGERTRIPISSISFPIEGLQ